MLAYMEQDNPSPTLAPTLSTRCSANPDASIQPWESLTMQAEEEDVYLCELAGVSCLEEITSLQAVINTTTSTVDHLGPKLTNLDILNLNGSCLASIRDLGSGFRCLSVLWVARCGLNSLDGISCLPSLRELYCSYNDINELQPLIDCQLLEVLDLEGNSLTEPDALEHLAACPHLQALTLSGNTVEQQPNHIQHLVSTLPHLLYYNDQPVAEAVAQAQSTLDQRRQPQRASDHGSLAADEVAQCGRVTEHAVSEPDKLEMSLVLQGIKYAQVGFDSNEFKEITGSMLMSISQPTACATDPQPAAATGKAPVQPLCTSASGAGISCSGNAWLGPPVAGSCDGGGGGMSRGWCPASQPSIPAAAPIMPPRPLSASAVVVPVSTSAWLRTLQSSTAGALANLRASREGTLQAQFSSTPPGSAGSATASPGGSRPASSGTTRDSNGSTRLSTTSQGVANTGRPGSAMLHTSRPFSARPGTSGSSVAGSGRPGTASLQSMHSQGGLYWKKNRISTTAAATIVQGSGLDGQVEELGVAAGTQDGQAGGAGSVLTCGGDAIGGSLARDLRKRRQLTSQSQPSTATTTNSTWRVAAVHGSKGSIQGSREQQALLASSAVALNTVYDSRQLLEELKQWKLETADRALLEEEGAQDGSQGLWGGCSATCSEDGLSGVAATDAAAADILDLTAFQSADGSSSRPATSSSSQQQVPEAAGPRITSAQASRDGVARSRDGKPSDVLVGSRSDVVKARGTHRTMLSKVIKDLSPQGGGSKPKPCIHTALSSAGSMQRQGQSSARTLNKVITKPVLGQGASLERSRPGSQEAQPGAPARKQLGSTAESGPDVMPAACMVTCVAGEVDLNSVNPRPRSRQDEDHDE